MSDLIRREDAIEAVYQALRTPLPDHKNDFFHDSMSLAVAMVNEVPSAEPERKKGEWIERKVYAMTIVDYQSAKCSVCGKYHTTPYQYYFDNYKFCPNCGAEMRGGDESA